MKPDIIINVRFLTSDEGGREKPIMGKKYSCPLIINEACGYDCRFVLNSESYFEPGYEYDIPIKFLNFKSALKDIVEGMRITLWEGKTIAEGKVIKVFND